MNSDVINFNVISIEPKLSYRLRRSTDSLGFLVTFEISLTASEDIEIVEKLSDIFSKVEQ